MAVTEEPILSRLDRVDNMLRQLEELRGTRSPKSSSYASTPSSEGHASSFDDHISPKSLEKHCLPLNRVMLDTEIKGTLVQRIDLVEQRLLKLCMQLEGELENEKKKQENNTKAAKSGKKKGLKGLVNCMVKGKNNHHKTN